MLPLVCILQACKAAGLEQVGGRGGGRWMRMRPRAESDGPSGLRTERTFGGLERIVRLSEGL